LESLQALGFSGMLFAVNARGEAVGEWPGFRRVSEIPHEVDHVIVAIPAGAILEVLEDCARKGVRSVTVFSSGFGETGESRGRALEQEVRRWLRGRALRLIGPNCMGIYCPESGLGFRPDFPKEPGPIGFVSQSGGMTITGVLMAAARGLRFSKVISYGNEADVNSVELLDYLAQDPKTRLIWAYLEGAPHGRALVRAMEAAARTKPLLVLKGGKTESGGRAAASHTGSMAGAPQIWEGVIRKAGGLSVRTLEQMVDTSLALLWLPPCRGRRAGMVCVSGGLSVNYTDLAVQSGFEVPRLSPRLVARLREVMDLPGTSLNNPLDLAAGYFQYPAYGQLFRTLGESGEMDFIILILALEYFYLPESRYPGISRALVQAFLEAGRDCKLPFCVVMPQVQEDPRQKEFEKKFAAARIPVFPSMERALEALRGWMKWWERRRSGTSSP
jgi:acyl-CoA synthetase (NDP forming)